VELVQGDLRDPPSLAPALQGVRMLVHLAAILPGPLEPHRDLWETNVEGTRSIARAARTAGVARFVHVSSAGVYGDGDGAPHRESAACQPTDEYERSKLESERALAEHLRGSMTAWTVLRPAGIYGPGRASSIDFYRRVARRRIWLHGPARIVVHPTHVRDVVQAILLVLDAPDIGGETINVGGERPVDYRELVEMVARRLGVHVAQIALPYPVAWTLATTAQSFLGVFGAPAPARLRRLRRRLVSRALDTSKARDRLGFTPTSLERGLDETIDWARQEGLLAGARS
jgi:nucleoside-diphosphate-sugar epimerase